MPYIQRYPFAPKAVWWKRYNDKASLGKRVIYRATDTLGFEIEGLPQIFKPRILFDGKLKTSEQVEYINVINPLVAVRLADRFYMYNVDTQNMEEEDIVDEGIQIINASLGNIMRIEKNTYIRQFKFDCIKVEDQRNGIYQPIKGLFVDSSFVTIQTYSFQNKTVVPSTDDLIFYKDRFWMIEDISCGSNYRPREEKVHILSLKAIK